MEPCPFCQIDPTRVIAQNAHAMAIRDAYPVAEGHTLIIPKRHVLSFFDISPDEQRDLLALLREVRSGADCNIGINDGPAAGQTVPHLHIHLIPRTAGDVPDPRGGVRWVIPHKARYWP